MKHGNRAEDTVYSRAAFDSPANQKSRSNQKRQAIIDTWQQPIWPKLAKILFISMLVLSAAMALVELKNALLLTTFSVQRFVMNLSVTLLYIWGIYSALLVVCCIIGSNANRRAYKKRKAESGIQDSTEEERKRSARAVRRLNAAYRLYIKVGLVGFAIALIVFSISRIF